MINDLKAKLPLKKQNEAQGSEEEEYTDIDLRESSDSERDSDLTSATAFSEIEEEEIEAEEPQSLMDRLRSKFSSTKGEGKTEVDGVKSRKTPSPIFILVLVILIAVLFIDLEDEQPAEQASQLKLRPRLDKKNKKDEAPTTTETNVEAAPTTEANVEATGSTPEPLETISVPDKEATSVETASTDDTPLTEAAPSQTIPETVGPEGDITPIDGTKPILTEANDVVTTSETSDMQGDLVDETIPTFADNDSMTEKILEDLEKQVAKNKPREEKKTYIAPPDYEYLGRGMVYNCTGKHWACVDGPSYKTCEDNFSSTKFLGKPIECYPFNVYEGQKGCELMQNRLVSSSAKTDFCKGD